MKVGIVGWGVISDIHAQALIAAYNSDIAAVYTSDKNKNSQILKKYSITVFNDYHEMLNSGLVDTVSICTPSGAHLDFAIEASKMKINVIIEKPIEVNIDRGKQIINKCEENNVQLAIIYQSRFLESVQKIKSLIDSNDLGKVFHASAYIKWFRSQEYYDSGAWRGTKELDGGGVLINQAIHTIDLLQYLVGDVKNLFANIGTFTHNNIEVEDSATVTLNFENGAIGSIEASTSIQPAQSRRIEIHGEMGTVILDGDDDIIQLTDFANDNQKSKDIVGADSPLAGFSIEPHKLQFENISDSFSTTSETIVSGAEALKSLAIVEAIYKSNEIRKEVYLKNIIGE